MAIVVEAAEVRTRMAGSEAREAAVGMIAAAAAMERLELVVGAKREGTGTGARAVTVASAKARVLAAALAVVAPPQSNLFHHLH